jgi:hypothetical protein
MDAWDVCGQNRAQSNIRESELATWDYKLASVFVLKQGERHRQSTFDAGGLHLLKEFSLECEINSRVLLLRKQKYARRLPT